MAHLYTSSRLFAITWDNYSWMQTIYSKAHHLSETFKRNYYAFRSDLLVYKRFSERYGGMLPSPYTGGLTTSYEGFKNFMLDQAKYNPIEVSAFSFSYSGSDIVQYFVEPWVNNSGIEAQTNPYNIPGFSQGKISHMYESFHTHPSGNHVRGLSDRDMTAHRNMKIPVNAIEANREVYRIDAVIRYNSGNDFYLILPLGYKGDVIRW